MDSVFKSFDKEIKSRRDEYFAQYLCEQILNPLALSVLREIMQQTKVYIFSGVIRDYFLGRESEHRDIDIVLEHNISWWSIFRRYRRCISVKVNSFGGIKAKIDNLTVDLWTMQNTWGIMRKGVRNTPQNLIRTAFFNFSAVVYSVDRRRFYIHKSFAQFVNDRVIDILYKENPNVPLCIVNTMYYSQLLQMPLAPELENWIVSHYSMFDNYEIPQLSHWGVIRYSHRDIHLFVSRCERGGSASAK